MHRHADQPALEPKAPALEPKAPALEPKAPALEPNAALFVMSVTCAEVFVTALLEPHTAQFEANHHAGFALDAYSAVCVVRTTVLEPKSPVLSLTVHNNRELRVPAVTRYRFPI